MNKHGFLISGTGMIFIALFCNFLWGSAFPFVKLAYHFFDIEAGEAASQILMGGCRFTAAGILLLLFGRRLGGQSWKVTRGQMKKIVPLALVQTVGQYVFFNIGLAHTSGVKGSIIVGTSVFFSILLSGLVFKLEKLKGMKFLGCLVGFTGVVMVNLQGKGFDFQFLWNGEGFIMMSALCYAFSTAMMKIYGKEEDPVFLAGSQFALGGLIMILLGIVMGGSLGLAYPFMAGMLLLYLAFLSAAAYSLWGLLLKYHPVSKVAVYGLTNPIFGVFLSALLLGETRQAMRWQTFLALPLVCLGIWIVNRQWEEG